MLVNSKQMACSTVENYCLKLAILLLASLIVLSGCGSSSPFTDDASGAPPRRGGTVWLESAQEPVVLNTYVGAGGMSITDVVTTPLKSQWVYIDDRGKYQPLLASKIPTLENGGVTLTSDKKMYVKFPIDKDAIWSDGVTISCTDLRFTWKTLMNPRFAIGSRLGWEDIEDVKCPSAKQVEIVFKRPLASYISSILVTAPLPSHELQGKDFDTVWNNRITVSSGPFIFKKWDRGDRLVLERNPRWWRAGAEGRPYLDRLVVRFVPDPSTMKLDLRMEDADIIGPPADTNLPDELADIKTATYDARPSSNWENVTFNTIRFPFNDAQVRRAASYTIDRDAIVNIVLKRQVPRLDSTLLPPQAPYYTPTFSQYKPNKAKAENEMHSAGFKRSSNGIWEKNGKVASILLATNSGNPLRLKTIQLIAKQLEAFGFKTDIQIVKQEVFFSSVVSRGRFDIAIYSFNQNMDPSQSRYFACSEIAKAPNWVGKNNFHYCRRSVDTLLRKADAEINVSKRIELTHEAQEQIANDAPTLPLYQPPDTLAWNRRVHGVRPNSMGRHLWNSDQWWVTNP